MHRDQALLYASGETNAAETAPFESHLPDCADCLDRVSLAKAVQRSTKSVLETPPPEVFAQALRLQGGLGGSALPKWFRLLLTAAAIAAAFWWVQRTRNAPPPEEPAPAATGRNSLSMPGKKARRAAARPLSRGPSRRAAPSSVFPMPARPVDCGDRSSLLEFKRYAWYKFGGGQPHGVYTADRWAACICGGAAQAAGRPKPPPAGNFSGAAPACPEFTVGAVSKGRRDAFIGGFLSAAKKFHESLPVSREQAARLTACLCGAIPDEAP